MRVIGLTGGIASGKSTVARMFAALGAPVVDADQIAREVVEPGQPALEEIVRSFGRDLLDDRGALDRKKLAARVFAEPATRRALEAITHPRIAQVTRERLAALEAAGAELALYEAALLVETGLYRGLDGLVVVAVDEERQRARLAAREGLSPHEIEARLAAQAPLADKLAAATWVIDNHGTLDETRRQVDALWPRLNAAPTDSTR